MKQETIEALRAHLVHLGAMPGEAEIMAAHADNNLPAEADIKTAIDYIKTQFGV